MEKLLNDLAEILNTSVDGVLNMYPVIRDQYVKSYVIVKLGNTITTLSIVVCILASMFTMAGIIGLIMEDETEVLKYSTIIWAVFFIFIIINIILNNITIQLAPDLMFIKNFV